MSVALSNILANEDIRRRERERSLQVAIVNTLSQDLPWPERLRQVARVLGSFLDCSVVIFDLQPEGSTERFHAYQQIGADEHRHFDHARFLEFTDLSEAECQKARRKDQPPRLLVGQDFEKYAAHDKMGQRLAERFRVRSWLSTPLTLARPGHYHLHFLSRHPQGYREADRQLLLHVRSALALVLDRLLAYEEVEHLNRRLQQEKDYLQEEVNTPYRFEHIIGESAVMQAVFERVQQVATLDTGVLVLGETGTGKELIARAIHRQSGRCEQPLIKVNCAALPEHLIESELFGHEKGAFTGAVQQRIGRFELADRGTIFLDEIGELSLPLQAKLLRVLQEREFERLGGNRVIRSDFRLIAATNRSLQQAVSAGDFRLDLYYRLNTFPIMLPPLRDRHDDVFLLSDHFARQYTRKLGKPFGGFTPATQRYFRQYDWPGNVRELQNVVEQAAIGARQPTLHVTVPALAPQDLPDVPGLRPPTEAVDAHYIKEQLATLERHYLLRVLEATHWKVSGPHGAATRLGLKPTTLEARMKRLNIQR